MTPGRRVVRLKKQGATALTAGSGPRTHAPPEEGGRNRDCQDSLRIVTCVE